MLAVTAVSVSGTIDDALVGETSQLWLVVFQHVVCVGAKLLGGKVLLHERMQSRGDGRNFYHRLRLWFRFRLRSRFRFGRYGCYGFGLYLCRYRMRRWGIAELGVSYGGVFFSPFVKRFLDSFWARRCDGINISNADI